MPPLLAVILVGLFLLYIGYLQLQLYISRRIINALQETTLVAEPERRPGFNPVPLAFVMFVLIGLLLVGAR
jgi:hypothetical protein